MSTEKLNTNSSETKISKGSRSEESHAVNIANFELIIALCVGLGSVYSPSKNALKIPQLKELLANANSMMQLVKIAKTKQENARNARELAMSSPVLRKLSTRIINALEATDASKLTVENAKSINRKIQGKRAAASKNNTSEQNNISVSQQSYDGLLDNFILLVECISTEPLYTPNEADLKVSNLKATISNFNLLNTNFIASLAPYKKTLIDRDALFYNETTGLVAIAQEIKKYIKSIYGPSSPQYKEFSALKFKMFRR